MINILGKIILVLFTFYGSLMTCKRSSNKCGNVHDPPILAHSSNQAKLVVDVDRAKIKHISKMCKVAYLHIRSGQILFHFNRESGDNHALCRVVDLSTLYPHVTNLSLSAWYQVSPKFLKSPELLLASTFIPVVLATDEMVTLRDLMSVYNPHNSLWDLGM